MSQPRDDAPDLTDEDPAGSEDGYPEGTPDDRGSSEVLPDSAGEEPTRVSAAYRGTAGDGSGRGRIVLAATPIGNRGDATERLIGLLRSADVVAAEDTRRLHRLVQALGVTVTGRVISYHEHNEAERTPELLDLVRDGATLLMVTDAGMPSVSDPGYRLVEAAVGEGFDLTAVPGASAVLAALALCLPTDRFCFEGFLPRKPGVRAGRLADLASERRTMVFFEAPHRLEPMLRSLQQAFGSDRPAAVARELTKVHEQVVRGSLLELLQWAQDTEVRGEIAVVVAGAPEAPPSRPEDHVAEVNTLIGGGMRLKDAVAAVASDSRVSKRELYAAVIAAR